MAKFLEIRQMEAYIRSLRTEIAKSHNKTLLQAGKDAKDLAIRNAKKQFIGRNGRILSGGLLASIFTSFQAGRGISPKVFIGTRGIPYGRIHEKGGTIVPVKANHLWVKLFLKGSKKFKSWTPRDFMNRRKQFPGNFPIFKSKKGNLIAGFSTLRTSRKGKKTFKILPLFSLKDQVKIPKRPYLTPAAEAVVKRYANIALDISAMNASITESAFSTSSHAWISNVH